MRRPAGGSRVPTADRSAPVPAGGTGIVRRPLAPGPARGMFRRAGGLLEGHLPLLEAIKAREGARARELMRQHVTGFDRDARAVLIDPATAPQALGRREGGRKT